ncbi:unnamed protein product [Mytilus coruscus]|uniref:B box-type domain-containing protein n=1 Tax=Mytilus coruscus TaxID=42192 RepID=A0A6J8DN52_MYTCO|nr:unnamed protein product [Mytilus coruscus]
MDGMLCHILQLLILITCSGLSKSNLECLTWNIQQERLELICRVSNFSHPVSLIDSHGQIYAKCTFERNIQHCIPVVRNESIVTHYALKYVIFTTDGLTKDMNGEWICLQAIVKLKTYVSLSKGIIDSTELGVDITGKYRNEKDNPRTIISCFSCREPYGCNVEFLEDKRSVDSLTFSNDTDTCTHGKGECHPDECNCTRNEFTRASQYDTESNGSIYSCDMLFTDPYTHAKFLITASVFRKGKEFYQMNKSTTIIKAADKVWKETFSSDKKIKITQEVHPTLTTPVAETSDDIEAESKGGLQALEVIAIVAACLVLFVFALFFVRQHYKRKASRKDMIPEGIEIDECEPLFESQNKSTIQTQTEDNKIESATMTEESYLLQEKSVFKRNESSNGTNLNTCDPCSFQYKDRLAVFYCIDCEESLCANCSNYHKIMKQTRNHNNVSMNKIPTNFSLPLTCTDHETMKHEYYCVDHECLCCVRCIATGHAGKGCKLEQIDDASKGFTKTQVFLDYDCHLNRYIDLLVELSAYQYHMIDHMTNTLDSTFIKSQCDDNTEQSKANEVDIQPITDLDDIKLRLNAYAKETCYILYSAGEQKGLFDFMKDNGSDRQLFILTHSLRQRLIEIDKRVSELVGHTKHAISYDKQSLEVHSATFPTIERELTNISFHRWRQSQTAVKDPALK